MHAGIEYRLGPKYGTAFLRPPSPPHDFEFRRLHFSVCSFESLGSESLRNYLIYVILGFLDYFDVK